jgi:hypothetical protein
MTYQGPKRQFVAGDDRDPAWGAARSDWLDAFADLELEIGRCIARRCVGKNKKSFSQRLDDLAALEPGPDLSCRDQARLGALVCQCRQLLLLRGTIVHSHMRVGLIDNVAVALFINMAGEARKPLSQVALTQEQFTSSIEDLRRLAADLRPFG